MRATLIFIPVIGMVMLTMFAWIYMFLVRIPAIKKAGINLEKVRTRALDTMLPEKAQVASQHFMNLLEMPVLFYVLAGFLYVTGTLDAGFIYCAFAFVALRAVHTLIHLSYNNVMQRFSIYILSSLVLWFMWLKFAWIILQ